MLQLIYADGGDPRVLYCGSQSKRQISETFSAKTGFSFNINQSARTMISNINRYEGSFGTLDIMPDRFISPEKIHIVTPDFIRVAVLRDIPGLVIASPARGEDAVGMMRTCLALALATGRVVAFLEPIALYHTRDLHEESDGGWLDAAPDPDYRVPLGRARLYREEGRDLTIISYANGLFYSLQAAHALAKQGVAARVLDLRWLAPLDSVAICREARATGRVLVVDECRQTGSISEAIVTLLCEDGCEDGADLKIARVTGEDTFIPLGAAAELVMPSAKRIEQAALELVART